MEMLSSITRGRNRISVCRFQPPSGHALSAACFYGMLALLVAAPRAAAEFRIAFTWASTTRATSLEARPQRASGWSR